MARELELNVRPIFSTPLLVFSIPEAERLNAELTRAVLTREASEPAYHDREVIGWSSPNTVRVRHPGRDSGYGVFRAHRQGITTARLAGGRDLGERPAVRRQQRLPCPPRCLLVRGLLCGCG